MTDEMIGYLGFILKHLKKKEKKRDRWNNVENFWLLVYLGDEYTGVYYITSLLSYLFENFCNTIKN